MHDETNISKSLKWWLDQTAKEAAEDGDIWRIFRHIMGIADSDFGISDANKIVCIRYLGQAYCDALQTYVRCMLEGSDKAEMEAHTCGKGGCYDSERH